MKHCCSLNPSVSLLRMSGRLHDRSTILETPTSSPMVIEVGDKEPGASTIKEEETGEHLFRPSRLLAIHPEGTRDRCTVKSQQGTPLFKDTYR